MSEFNPRTELSRRRFLGLAAGTAGMSALTLLGCGGGTGGVASTPPPSGSSGSISKAKATKPLTLWNWDTREEWITALNNVVADFKSESGITVNVVAIPSASLSQKLESSIPSNTLPDLYYGDTSFPAYVEQNILVDLDDVVKDLGKDAFFPAMIDYSTWKGKIYSLPFINYPRVLWYRKDYLQQAGVKVPTSWGELKAAAEKLTDTSKNRYGFLNFNLYPDQPPMEDLMITNNAVAIDKKGKVTLDTPATVGAIQMIADLGEVQPPGVGDHRPTIHAHTVPTGTGRPDDHLDIGHRRARRQPAERAIVRSDATSRERGEEERYHRTRGMVGHQGCPDRRGQALPRVLLPAGQLPKIR